MTDDNPFAASGMAEEDAATPAAPALAADPTNPFTAHGMAAEDAHTGGGGGAPGLLGNTGNETWTSGAAKGTATGAIRGGADIAGTPGDLGRISAALGRLAEKAPGFVQQIPDVALFEALARNNPLAKYAPSSQDLKNLAAKYLGAYQPTTTIGKAGMGAVEGATAMAPFMATGPLSAGTALATLAPGALSGAGSEVAANSPLATTALGEPGARLLGGSLGAFAPGRIAGAAREVAGMPFMPEAAQEWGARPLAAGAAQAAASDPEAALKALQAKQVSPGGVTLPPSVQGDDRGLKMLEEAIAKHIPGASEDIAGQQAQNMETLKGNAPQFAAPQTAETGEASTAAREAFDQQFEQQKAAEKDLWNVPQLKGAGLFRNKVTNQISDYLDNLGVSEAGALPTAKIKSTLDQWEKRYGSQIPFKEAQDLRSSILGQARSTDDAFQKMQLNNFAKHIGDVMSDKGNVRFGDAYDAVGAWNAARAATKSFNETFMNPALAKFSSEKAGIQAVSPEATISTLFSGKNAPQNIRAFRAAVQDHPETMDAMSDYMVSKLTNNGATTPRADQIETFIGKNRDVLNELPGAEDKLRVLQKSSLGGELQDALSSPANASKFFKQRSDIINNLPQDDKDRFNEINDAVEALGRTPQGQIGSLDQFYKLTKGRLIDMIGATALGKIGRMGVALGGAHLLGLNGEGMDMALAIAGLEGPEVAGQLFGNARDRAKDMLRRAATDPATMAKLMQPATPQALANAEKAAIARNAVTSGGQASGP